MAKTSLSPMDFVDAVQKLTMKGAKVRGGSCCHGMGWGKRMDMDAGATIPSASSTSGVPTASTQNSFGLVKAARDCGRHSVGLQRHLEPHQARDWTVSHGSGGLQEVREDSPFQAAPSPFPTLKKGIVKAAEPRPPIRPRELQFAVVIGPETLLILGWMAWGRLAWPVPAAPLLGLV